MEFLLQQGWGMMGLDEEFIERGFADGVILSPRVYKLCQIERHAHRITDLGGELLFDPQFYEPHTEREKLLDLPFWKNIDFDTSTFKNEKASSFCRSCLEYQIEELKVSRVIIPGRYSNSVDENWLEIHHNFAETAASMKLDIPIYATVAIGPDAILNNEMFQNAIDEVSSYPVNGVYFVFRHPMDTFLIEDEGFLYTLLNGFLDLRLSGKMLIIGYSNQQSLMFAVSGIESLASGNFRNTRYFNPEIFDVQEETDLQRATWYYDAGTLSEFRIHSLSLAYRRGLRDLFGPGCDYCGALLESNDPASIRWREPDAFRHFLFEMNRQWKGIDNQTPQTIINGVYDLIQQASQRLNRLSANGFHLGERSFNKYIDPTLAALQALITDRENDINRS